jgi:hypothetical protein
VFGEPPLGWENPAETADLRRKILMHPESFPTFLPPVPIAAARDQLAGMLRDLPSLLNREIPKRLGGNWDRTSLTRVLGRYWRHLYTLRNRVVHAGYVPSV